MRIKFQNIYLVSVYTHTTSCDDCFFNDYHFNEHTVYPKCKKPAFFEHCSPFFVWKLDTKRKEKLDRILNKL